VFSSVVITDLKWDLAVIQNEKLKDVSALPYFSTSNTYYSHFLQQWGFIATVVLENWEQAYVHFQQEDNCVHQEHDCGQKDEGCGQPYLWWVAFFTIFAALMASQSGVSHVPKTAKANKQNEYYPLFIKLEPMPNGGSYGWRCDLCKINKIFKGQWLLHKSEGSYFAWRGSSVDICAHTSNPEWGLNMRKCIRMLKGWKIDETILVAILALLMAMSQGFSTNQGRGVWHMFKKSHHMVQPQFKKVEWWKCSRERSRDKSGKGQWCFWYHF